jgi:hypothetical protein
MKPVEGMVGAGDSFVVICIGLPPFFGVRGNPGRSEVKKKVCEIEKFRGLGK